MGRSPRAARNTLLNHRHTIGTAHHPPLQQQSLYLPLHLPLHRSCLKESRKENNEPVRKCTTADGLEIIGVFKVSLVPVPKVGFFGGAGCSIYPPGNEFIKNLGRHTWIKITGSWPLDASVSRSAACLAPIAQFVPRATSLAQLWCGWSCRPPCAGKMYAWVAPTHLMQSGTASLTVRSGTVSELFFLPSPESGMHL